MKKNKLYFYRTKLSPITTVVNSYQWVFFKNLPDLRLIQTVTAKNAGNISP